MQETLFQVVSHKKNHLPSQHSSHATSSSSVLSKYTQICIFPSIKLHKGIDDISSKIIAINKCLPLDKVPKNFYCIMGHITSQENMVFCFPSFFSYNLILRFKNIILNTLSLSLSTIILPVTIEQGYYITGVLINHPNTGLKLSESDPLKELKINYPNVLFTKVNILPLSNNLKFAESQLSSANVFVLSSDADKIDDIIFNNLPFIIFHS